MTAAGALAIGLAACGSGSEETTAFTTAPGTLPPGAPQQKVIAHQFPKPKPTAGAPAGATKAIAAGRLACKGKTPSEVRDEFIQEAREGGRLNSGQEQMLQEMSKYEQEARTTPDFVAGQLAAGVYEATLPERLARSGYQGCVYELAVQLRHELTQQGKQGKKKNGK